MQIKAMVIQEMLNHGFSYKRISRLLGVSFKTIWKAKKVPPNHVFHTKTRLKHRSIQPHWKKRGEKDVYILFYICLPKWIEERFLKGSIEYEEAYDTLSYGLWTSEKLFSLSGEEFFKYACGYVKRRLFGSFRMWSDRKKQELFFKKQDFFIDNISLIY